MYLLESLECFSLTKNIFSITQYKYEKIVVAIRKRKIHIYDLSWICSRHRGEFVSDLKHPCVPKGWLAEKKTRKKMSSIGEVHCQNSSESTSRSPLRYFSCISAIRRADETIRTKEKMYCTPTYIPARDELPRGSRGKMMVKVHRSQ